MREEILSSFDCLKFSNLFKAALDFFLINNCDNKILKYTLQFANILPKFKPKSFSKLPPIESLRSLVGKPHLRSISERSDILK